MTSTDPSESARKAELVCRNCDRTARLDGEWAESVYERDGTRRRVYDCPDCGHTVVAQPLFRDGVVVPA